ncbi:MAG: hypothetical protein ACREMG_05910, partial [Gemmatimonadales bacterium]
RWQEGSCRNDATGHRFACRMYPRESEAHPAAHDPGRVLGSLDEVRADLHDILLSGGRQDAVIWVVFGAGRVESDRAFLLREDRLLVEELLRLGLKPGRVGGVVGVTRFLRPE